MLTEEKTEHTDIQEQSDKIQNSEESDSVEALSDSTEYKEPPSFSNANYLEDFGIDPETENKSSANNNTTVSDKPVSIGEYPEITKEAKQSADNFIVLFDSFSQLGTVELIKRKRKKRMFKDDAQFHKAQRYSKMLNEELDELDNPKTARALADRHKKYERANRDLDDKYELKSSEKKALRKPLEQMFAQSGTQMSPSASLTIALLTILAARIPDVISA